MRTDRRSPLSWWALVAPWLQFAFGGFVAGLIAWGGMTSRITALEQRQNSAVAEMNAIELRAAEDRALLRESIHDLNAQLSELTRELQRERLDRVRGQPHSRLFDR